MVGVIISVDDPYNLKQHDSKNLPLAEGMFVSARITGKSLKDAVEIPRSALRDGSTVWIADSKNQLLIRPVKLHRKTRDSVIIADGLENGECIITSGVNGAANGMQLRILSPEASQ
jgi:multidrug efflux pump subunit AcrA (membrane-fusion protein)